MHFELVQHVHGPLEAVESAFVDPAFLHQLGALPKLGSPELLDQTEEGNLVHQRLRYAFVGHLSPVVTRVVDPARLTWVEESTLDRTTHQTTWRIVPDNYANLLEASGVITLAPDAEGATVRRTEGDVRVGVPFVGRKVEAAIISGLQEHAALEAEMVNQWVSSPPFPSGG